MSELERIFAKYEEQAEDELQSLREFKAGVLGVIKNVKAGDLNFEEAVEQIEELAE